MANTCTVYQHINADYDTVISGNYFLIHCIR